MKSLSSAKGRRRAFASRDPSLVTTRILDAAQSEFMKVGLHAANTNTIALAFGGSKATLFRYFSTKDALLEAVVRRIASRWQEVVKWDVSQDSSPSKWLRSFGEMTLTWLVSDDALFVGRLVVAEGHKFPILRGIFFEHASRPLLNALSLQLCRWVDDGTLLSAHIDREVGHFFDLVFSGVISRCLYGGAKPNDAAIALHVSSAVDLFLRAMSVPPK